MEPGIINILAEVVVGSHVRRIADQLLDQELGGEHVDAHGGERDIRAARHRLRIGRLFDEADDAAGAVHVHHAEAAGLVQRHLDAADGEVGALLDVCRKHGSVIHLVDVVASEDQHVRGRVVTDDVNILVGRVRGAGIPGRLAHPLLRR